VPFPPRRSSDLYVWGRGGGLEAEATAAEVTAVLEDLTRVAGGGALAEQCEAHEPFERRGQLANSRIEGHPLIFGDEDAVVGHELVVRRGRSAGRDRVPIDGQDLHLRHVVRWPRDPDAFRREAGKSVDVGDGVEHGFLASNGEAHSASSSCRCPEYRSRPRRSGRAALAGVGAAGPGSLVPPC